MSRYTIFVAILLLLFACAPVGEKLTSEGFREVRGKELRALLADVVVKSDAWRNVYVKEGGVAGINTEGESYNGKWELNEDGQLCVKSAYRPIHGCAAIYVNEDTFETVWIEADGSSYQVKISPAL